VLMLELDVSDSCLVDDVCMCWCSVGIVAVQGLLDPVALYKVSPCAHVYAAAAVN